MTLPFVLLMLSLAMQLGRDARSPFAVEYTLRVDATDTTVFAVDMRVRNAPDTFSVAMAAHSEYDDRFFRYVEQFTAQSVNGGTTRPARITRVADALWRVTSDGGDVVLRYRIHLPAPPPGLRPAWQPFIRSTGALVGGPHSFMYLVNASRSPVSVHLDLPAGWAIATGLDTSTNARTFTAENAAALMDSPMLVGRLHRWRFQAGGGRHEVVYWPLPNAAPFDTITFVRQVERMTQQAVSVFGTAPYKHFSFLYQDGAYGGLEHARSVTLGAPSVDLARSTSAHLAETAHEYFHTWNLVRIRPVELVDIDYRPNGRTPGLWFSEGVTMLYADLLLRRAALPIDDSSRVRHLAGLIERFQGNPAYQVLSPEQASLAEFNVPLFERGDYAASPHLQGELLGTLLDLMIRERTHGARSLDDVMRTMMSRHSGARGFSGKDLERAFADACACDLAPFFDAHVRSHVRPDFNALLRPIGLEMRVQWQPVLDPENHAAQDLRIRPMTESDSGALLLRQWNPTSIWGKAGLHTGDTLIAVNALPMRTRDDFYPLVARAGMGDTVRVTVGSRTGRHTAVVVMAGYDRPVVQLVPRADATPAQVALRARWASGMP